MKSSSVKVIIAAFTGNLLIALTKFIAAAVTGSSAMFSEAIHSVVDTGNQILLMYGLHRSQKPPDDRFPFGYGKEIYFWSFVVAIMIFAVGAGFSIYEGIHHLNHPVPIESPLVNYIVLILSMIFEGASCTIAVKEFRKTKGKKNIWEAIHGGKDPSLFVVLFEDVAALLGLAVAFIGVILTHITGALFFDGIASIIIGCILGATSLWLAYETKSLLIGESADTPIILTIRKIVSSFEGIDNINDVLTIHMGPDFILVNLSVDFKDTLTAADVERISTEIAQELKSQVPIIKRVFIDPESAAGRSSKNI